VSAFLQEMFKVKAYKKKQGKICRMATAFAIFLLLSAGIYQLYYSYLDDKGVFGVYILPLLLLFLNAWFCYRTVNFPRFADFLIQVEAEMRKVSWPGKSELVRSSLVVIVVMFMFTVLLFGYDIALQSLFGWISSAMEYAAGKLGVF